MDHHPAPRSHARKLGALGKRDAKRLPTESGRPKFGNYPRDATTDPHLVEADLHNLWNWVRNRWGWSEKLASPIFWLDPNAAEERVLKRERINFTENSDRHAYRRLLPKWDNHLRLLKDGLHPSCAGPNAVLTLHVVCMAIGYLPSINQVKVESPGGQPR